MTTPFLLALILAAPQATPEQAAISVGAAQALARINAQAAALTSVGPDTQTSVAVVAMRVSDALRAPESPDVWQRLADVLPTLVASDSGNPSALLEAARLALDTLTADSATLGTQADDSLFLAGLSLAVSPPSVPQTRVRLDLGSATGSSSAARSERQRNPTQAAQARGAGPLGWLGKLDVADLRLSENELRFTIWAVLSLLAVLIVPRLLRKRSAPSESAPIVRTRLHQARVLAGQGASMADISRETRVAREALSLLLRPPV